MAKTFRPYDPDQLLVLPPSLREWLPEDHLVYFMSDLVEQLDLGAIYGSYTEERGYPPYHPVLMTKLLLYGYATGVYSSRKLARSCMEDVAFRVLCAGDAPDFRTIAAFRRRHLDSLSALFLQVLQLCRQAGLAKLGHVAIDGTKLQANASKHKAMSYARMQEEETRLKAEIEGLLAQAEAEDTAEDARYGPERRGDELPEELRHRESRLKKIQEAKAALERQAREEAEQAGRADAEKAVPKPKAQRNFTDPESRIMLDSQKAFVQAYNAQAAVDHESQVIVAVEVLQAANDKGQLVPMVKQVCRNLEESPQAVSADSGYWREADVKTLEDCEIPAFVAPGKIRHREWREQPRLSEPVPEDLPPKERMAYRLRTERGRAEYDKRKVTVEPVFGQIKGARGFRRFLLRGLEQVQAEWRLVCAVHNLLKLKGSGWRPRAKRGPGPRMSLAAM
jgi:transposase